MSQETQALDRPLDRRPGLITFAGVMMFLLAGFQVMFAFAEFWRATWITLNVYGDFGGYLWVWAILDALFALVAFYAGADLLRGGHFGPVLCILIASFSAIRWFFYLPAAPWLGAVIIAVAILIIYGIAAHGDFFNEAKSTSKL